MPSGIGRSFGVPAGAQRKRVPWGEGGAREPSPSGGGEECAARDDGAPPQSLQEAEGLPELRQYSDETRPGTVWFRASGLSKTSRKGKPRRVPAAAAAGIKQNPSFPGTCASEMTPSWRKWRLFCWKSSPFRHAVFLEKWRCHFFDTLTGPGTVWFRPRCVSYASAPGSGPRPRPGRG